MLESATLTGGALKFRKTKDTTMKGLRSSSLRTQFTLLGLLIFLPVSALSRQFQAHEAERRNVARDLHDEVGQILTGLKILLDRIPRPAHGTLELNLAEAQTLVGSLMSRVRELSLALRPAMLDDLGLLPALLWHCERFTAQTGVRVSFGHSGLADRRFSPKVETAVYRIVQEALTNVARHAGVASASVDVRADRRSLSLKVADHGAGLDLAAAFTAASSGLAGMYERAAGLNGRLTIETRLSVGTCVLASFPLDKRAIRRGGG